MGPVIVVSGLPRSGTSMMMRIMETGGIPVLMDGKRAPDTDNPHGYYELELVKRLPFGDNQWLRDAGGKAVKVISALLTYLPADYEYRIVFMRRNLQEILSSQRRMLVHRGAVPDLREDAKLEVQYRDHLRKTRSWLTRIPYARTLFMDYHQIVSYPLPHMMRLNQFLDGSLDVSAALSAVDPALYRNRS